MKNKEIVIHQINPASQVNKTVAKIYELLFKLLPQLPYFLDLAPIDFYLFVDLEKRPTLNEEVKQFWHQK